MENDDYSIVRPEAGIFVIADGMGGHPGGRQASTAAASSFYETIVALEPKFRIKRQYLAQAVDKANAFVRAIAKTGRMMTRLGTTLSAVVIQGSRGMIVHIGDSRIYLFRDNRLHRLTKDHTLVEALIEQGRVTEEGAKHYPLRNVLVRSVGTLEVVEPDILDLTLCIDDWLILATDGLTDVMDMESLERIVTAEKAGPVDRLCKTIMAMAQHNEPQDDISLITVRVVDVATPAYHTKQKRCN